MQFKYTDVWRAHNLGGSAFSVVGTGIEHQAMDDTWLEPGRIQQCLHCVDDMCLGGTACGAQESVLYVSVLLCII